MSERTLPLPPELGRLSTFIDSHIECLVGSSSELRTIALHAAKHIFDLALETEKSSKPHLGTLLTTLTEAAPPQTRSQARSSPISVQKSRKKVDIRVTPLPSLFIEGMNIDQIWQQLDLRTARVCENLQTLLGEDEGEHISLDGEDSDDDEEDDDDDDMDEDEDGTEEATWEEISDREDGSSPMEDVVDLRDESSNSEDDEDHEPPAPMLGVVNGRKRVASGSYSQGHSDLDDGFFDLATFNAETNEIEAKKVHKRKLNFVTDEDSIEDSEIDLYGSIDDSVNQDTNGGFALYYKDFFESPSGIRNRNTKSTKVRFHEQVSVKKIKAVGKGMPVSSMGDEEEDEDEDEDEEEDEDEDEDDDDDE